MAQMIYTWLRHALSISNPHNLYAPIPQSHPYLSPSSHYSRNGSIDSTTSTLRPDTEKASSPTRSRKWLSPRVLADATIGLSDGLTVPFALTAGLSALGDTKVVIYGGFAELFAGAISMGVGGYLGARGECQAYNAALSTTQRDVAAESKRVDEQIHMSLAEYGLSASTLAAVTAELKSSPDALEKR
ncbi:CCC1-like protein 2 [Elsinoe fawcettii]|nr:CCC1-like protein 2 [Elsinoe fawcettii]